jgi:hypothetical protein
MDISASRFAELNEEDQQLFLDFFYSNAGVTLKIEPLNTVEK